MERNDGAIRGTLRAMFDAAVASADPRRVLAPHLPDKPKGRCIVIGAGKASAAMAAAVEAAWPDAELCGAVVVPYGHGVPTRRVEVLEARHPVPDHNSRVAALRMLHLVHGLKPEDLVLALMSGGGSALLTLPARGVTLEDTQAVGRALLASGATIHEMNAVRKHLSAIKGGRLAMAARPAAVVTLAISDVPGGDPSVIASGPTVPDPSTLDDVRAIVARYGIDLPPAVEAFLERGEETPKPGEIGADVRIIASPAMALQAAAVAAQASGLKPLVLGELQGESRELGIIMAGIARSVREHGVPVEPPAVLISGGETTVSMSGASGGRGGRNMEFLLSLAIAAEGMNGMWALAGDTDGRDGSEDAAGAVVTPDTIARARGAGLEPRAVLEAHDSFTLFERLGDLVRTGPTLTNVNALRAVAIV
jgi:glycerate 2-kinase